MSHYYYSTCASLVAGLLQTGNKWSSEIIKIKEYFMYTRTRTHIHIHTYTHIRA